MSCRHIPEPFLFVIGFTVVLVVVVIVVVVGAGLEEVETAKDRKRDATLFTYAYLLVQWSLLLSCLELLAVLCLYVLYHWNQMKNLISLLCY